MKFDLALNGLSRPNTFNLAKFVLLGLKVYFGGFRPMGNCIKAIPHTMHPLIEEKQNQTSIYRERK
jgi:hypothetical protein